MATRGKWFNSRLTYYDDATHERVLPLAPVLFYDDFLGNAINTAAWGTRDAGAATEAVVADGANGWVGLTLDATNEVQVAGIDWADQRTLVLNQTLIFETRFRLSVLPTGSVVACIGLCGDYNAAVNTVAESIWFRLDGGGAVTVETDDTVHETSQVATGITLTAGASITARIDCSDIADVKFFINGDRVAGATVFDMSQVPALALQPVARIGKESAAVSVGTLQVDMVRAWMNRS